MAAQDAAAPRRQVAPRHALPEEGQDDGQAFWDNYWDCDHCSASDRSGDLHSVTKASDYYSARQWHSTGMYTDYLRPHGTEHELLMLLPAGPGPAAGPGRTVRLLFPRGPGPDFSERDRALLALLRPHLHQAYLDAERRRRGTPPLTPRHWELLYLVAAGHINAQIARRLGVSEGTVRIHLQNIYTRLRRADWIDLRGAFLVIWPADFTAAAGAEARTASPWLSSNSGQRQ
jgi:DNA-binding CsgD family transcriptional regulator